MTAYENVNGFLIFKKEKKPELLFVYGHKMYLDHRT